MKNQSRTIKTNPELYRVVMGGSGDYRRLPGGSDDFSLQTNRQTLRHNIYIIIIIIKIIIIITAIIQPERLSVGTLASRPATAARVPWSFPALLVVDDRPEYEEVLTGQHSR